VLRCPDVAEDRQGTAIGRFVSGFLKLQRICDRRRPGSVSTSAASDRCWARAIFEGLRPADNRQLHRPDERVGLVAPTGKERIR
jgi:hypothetical protein